MINKTEEEIMSAWKGDLQKPLVTVRCPTYNHKFFLSDALDGFLSQETTFPFEIILHDDASTDGTTDIVREYAAKYPNIIVPIIQTENQYSQGKGGVRKSIEPRIRGKYVALCEGDDYWTDPNKLEKQVTYMESHPECSMCVHAVNYLQDGKIIKNDRICEAARELTGEEIIENGGLFVATASICIRTDVYFQYPEWRRKASVGDYPMQILAALRGKVYYFPDIMAVYRVMSVGSWSQSQKNIENKQKRWLNEIEWLSDLEKEVEARYQKSIRRRIGGYALSLYKTGAFSFRQVMQYISAMPADGIKFKYFLSVIKHIPGRKKKSA